MTSFASLEPILISIKQINQYQKGVKFTLGKYVGMLQPGWRLVFPIVQSYVKVDLRIKAVDVPNQEAITKDNISVSVNAVIYYKIDSAEKVILEVENFYYAISQLAQTTMRNAVGQVDLDGLLSQRDKVSESIRAIIDKETDPWGIKVLNVELKDITLPEEMKRIIGKQAEAEREKRAIIIKAEGEVIAADNMAKAAKVLGESKGALHLRTLQSINDISSDQSNTIVFAVPLEVLRAFEGFGKNNPGSSPMPALPANNPAVSVRPQPQPQPMSSPQTPPQTPSQTPPPSTPPANSPEQPRPASQMM